MFTIIHSISNYVLQTFVCFFSVLLKTSFSFNTLHDRTQLPGKACGALTNLMCALNHKELMSWLEGEMIGLSMKAITKVKGIIGAEPWKYTPALRATLWPITRLKSTHERR